MFAVTESGLRPVRVPHLDEGLVGSAEGVCVWGGSEDAHALFHSVMHIRKVRNEIISMQNNT